MLASLQSHIERVLSPSWTDCVADTTPAHANKKISIAEVCTLLLWGILGDRRNLRDLETQSEIVGRRIPDSTIGDILLRLSPGELPSFIAGQIKDASRSKELRPVDLPFNITAIDGKNAYTTRAYIGRDGSCESAQARCNMTLRATLVSSSCAQVLGQRMIPEKSAETTELIPFIEHLEGLYTKTKFLEVVSVDAGMTHRKNAAYLHKKGVVYIMGLKKNQPDLYKIAEGLFKNKESVCSTTDTHSGNEVVRELSVVKVSGKFASWPEATELWRVHQICTHRKSDKVTTETRYFITNMPKAMTTKKHKLKAVRRHWGIENDAFWTLDAIFNEDECPFCSKALELVSYIRIMAFNIASRFRARRLKSKANRTLRWQDFIQYYQALFLYIHSTQKHPT